MTKYKTAFCTSYFCFGVTLLLKVNTQYSSLSICTICYQVKIIRILVNLKGKRQQEIGDLLHVLCVTMSFTLYCVLT